MTDTKILSILIAATCCVLMFNTFGDKALQTRVEILEKQVNQK